MAFWSERRHPTTYYHKIILVEDDTVLACGFNEEYGQLGLGDYDSRNTFTAGSQRVFFRVVLPSTRKKLAKLDLGATAPPP